MAAFGFVLLYHLPCLHTNCLPISKAGFSASNYATLRPSYPPQLYETILSFHKGPRNLLIDLGTGPGLVARYLSKSFDKVIGTDPSPGMIEQARSRTGKEQYLNIEYRQASAESLPFIENHSVDMVVAGQSSHWFKYPDVFTELKRIMRPGGTTAFFGYTDHVFVDYPKATELKNKIAYKDDKEALGPYWEMPGRGIILDQLRATIPPQNDWEVEHIVYEPGKSGRRTGTGGGPIMEKRMTLAENMEYVRTWSSFHGWQEAHPDRKRRSDGGDGDCIDDLFDEMVDAEDDWKTNKDWRNKEIDVEWGTAIVLGRLKG